MLSRCNRLLWLTCGFTLVFAQPALGESLPDKKPLVIRHRDADADGWSIAETRNFRILHYHSRTLAEKVACAAEQARTTALSRWFKEPGEDSGPRCDLYLYTIPADFSRYTGVPETVPGVATTRCDSGRVLSRRIDLFTSAEHSVEAILPHEVTHTVLASSFTESPLSIWANEGMAVLAEPRSKIDLHLDKLPQYRQEDQLYSVRQLLYLCIPILVPLPFYAQSVSLVEFLVSENTPDRDPFLCERAARRLRESLQRHYGWDFKELESRWRKHAFRPVR